MSAPVTANAKQVIRSAAKIVAKKTVVPRISSQQGWVYLRYVELLTNAPFEALEDIRGDIQDLSSQLPMMASRTAAYFVVYVEGDASLADAPSIKGKVDYVGRQVRTRFNSWNIRDTRVIGTAYNRWLEKTRFRPDNLGTVLYLRLYVGDF